MDDDAIGISIDPRRVAALFAAPDVPTGDAVLVEPFGDVMHLGDPPPPEMVSHEFRRRDGRRVRLTVRASYQQQCRYLFASDVAGAREVHGGVLSIEPHEPPRVGWALRVTDDTGWPDGYLRDWMGTQIPAWAEVLPDA